MASKPRNFNPDLYYHIYNRAIQEKERIFFGARDNQRFLNLFNYYRFEQLLPFSDFIKLPLRPNLGGLLKERVKVIAFVIMPNHFHFLVRPTESQPQAVSVFIGDLINGYTRYHNIKYKRGGPLLLGKFKSKEISDEASLLQVSRYIHLNPLVSSKTNKNRKLKKPQDYPYSSYHEWAGFKNPHLVDATEVKSWTHKMGGAKGYREFVEARIDKNPVLGIEDLILEDPSM